MFHNPFDVKQDETEDVRGSYFKAFTNDNVSVLIQVHEFANKRLIYHNW
jgi:hypothetical protein